MKIFYRVANGDDGLPHFRVWREDWPGDVFEVMTPIDFEFTAKHFQRFSFPMIQKFDDED